MVFLEKNLIKQILNLIETTQAALIIFFCDQQGIKGKLLGNNFAQALLFNRLLRFFLPGRNCALLARACGPLCLTKQFAEKAALLRRHRLGA